MVSSLYSDPENIGISHKRHGNRQFFGGGGNNRQFCVSIARTVTQTHGVDARVHGNVLEHR